MVNPFRLLVNLVDRFFFRLGKPISYRGFLISSVVSDEDLRERFLSAAKEAIDLIYRCDQRRFKRVVQAIPRIIHVRGNGAEIRNEMLMIFESNPDDVLFLAAVLVDSGTDKWLMDRGFRSDKYLQRLNAIASDETLRFVKLSIGEANFPDEESRHRWLRAFESQCKESKSANLAQVSAVHRKMKKQEFLSSISRLQGRDTKTNQH